MTTLENKLSIDFKLMKKYSKAFYAKVDRWNRYEAKIEETYKKEKEEEFTLELLIAKKIKNEQREILERWHCSHDCYYRFRGRIISTSYYERRYLNDDRAQLQIEKEIIRHYKKLI